MHDGDHPSSGPDDDATGAPPSMASPDSGDGDAALAPLRERIDGLDREILRLLNARAEVVVEIGRVKRAAAGPIYAPEREARVLSKIREHNAGPLSDRSLEAIYRELMSASFALERPLRIGYLGPEGSFSHLAAVTKFGRSVSFENLYEIESVFTEVRRGHVDYGLVPIENSIGGGIVEALDTFVKVGDEVTIYAEVVMSIEHNLLANCEPREIVEIHSKPEIFTQCRKWVRAQFPDAKLIPAASSAAAAEHARDEAEAGRRGVAAIGSRLAGERYGLDLLFESIEDEPNNLTRFLVLARERAKPSGDDKTTVMFRTAHAPGALAAVLSAFAAAGVNLTHIDKRPSGIENWAYTFFADLEGHRDDPAVTEGLARAAAHCEQVVVLGSYPRAPRPL